MAGLHDRLAVESAIRAIVYLGMLGVRHCFYVILMLCEKQPDDPQVSLERYISQKRTGDNTGSKGALLRY